MLRVALVAGVTSLFIAAISNICLPDQPAEKKANPTEPVQKLGPDVLTSWRQLLKRRDELQKEGTALQQKSLQLQEQHQKLNLQFENEVRAPMARMAESVYELNPGDLDAAEYLLFQSVQNRRFQAAAKLADQLIAAQRTAPYVLNAAGSAYFAIHEFSKARDAFQKAGSALDQSNYPRLAAVEKYVDYWKQEQERRKEDDSAVAEERLPRILLTTTLGEIELELFEKDAPNTVANFINLVESHEYDGTGLNASEQAFAMSAGTLGTRKDALLIPGSDLPDFKIQCECSAVNARKAFRGSVVMVHRGKDTGNSRFAILQEPRPELNASLPAITGNTVFGRVVRGLEVVDKTIDFKDLLLSATVIFKRPHVYKAERIIPKRPGIPGFTALQHGRLDDALTETSKAFEETSAKHGKEHPETLVAENRLGIVLLARGDYQSARERFERILKLRRKLLGEDHLLTAQSTNNLAVLLARLGEYSSARPLFEKALAARQKSEGVATAETLQARENLGQFLSELGQGEQGTQYFALAATALKQSVREQRFSLVDENDSAYFVEIEEIRPLFPMLESSLAACFVANSNVDRREIEDLRRMIESVPATASGAHGLFRLGLMTRRGDLSLVRQAAMDRATQIFSQLLGPLHFRTGIPLVHSYYGRGVAKHLLVLARRDQGTNSPQVATLERGVVIFKLNSLVTSVRSGTNRIDTSEIRECREHIAAALKITRDCCGELHPDVAKCWELYGISSYLEQRFQEASEYYEKALRIRTNSIGDEHVFTANILAALGNTSFHRGDLPKAQSNIAHALRIYNKLGIEVPTALNDFGVVAKARGDYVAARRSLEKYVESEPKNDIAKRNLMALLLELGDEEGLRYFEGEVKKNPKNIRAIVNLGAYARSKGDLASARRFFEQAQALDPQNEGVHQSSAVLQNLGAIARDSGEWERAAKYFEQTLSIEEKALGKHSPQVALTQSSIGLLKLRQGRVPEARESFLEALAVYQRTHGNRHLRTIEIYRLLGETAICAGNAQEAKKWFEASLDGKLQLAQDVLPTVSEAEALAFVASLKERDPLLLALKQLPDIGPLDAYQVVWRSRSLATRALTARRSVIARNASSGADWDELQWIRKQIANLIMSEKRTLTPPTTTQSAELQKLAPAEHEVALVKMRNAVLEQKLIELSQRKEVLERKLAERIEPYRQDQQLLQMPVTSLGKVLAKDVAVIEFVKTRNWSKPSVGGKQPMEKLFEQMMSDTFNYQAFVIRKSSTDTGVSVAWLDLGAAPMIDQAVTEWRSQISQKSGGAALGQRAVKSISSDIVRAPSQILRNSLWAPLEKQLEGITTVVLIPDGSLTQIPWPALPGRKEGTYLLDDFAVAMASHGQQVVELLESPAPTGDQMLLAGGVVYDDRPAPGGPNSDVVASREPIRGRTGLNSWQFLPGTREEARLIRTMRPRKDRTVLLEGGQASESEVSAMLPRSRFAHFATHGFFADGAVASSLQRAADPTSDVRLSLSNSQMRFEEIIGRNPMVLSGLVFAGANLPMEVDSSGFRIGEDGILTAEEVSDLDLRNTELVTLSACETGLGTVAGGEGVFGLQRAFRLAGARTVVASLWNVDDTATAALMTEFYRNLWEKRQGKLEALRQAQLTMLRRFEPRSGTLRGLQRIATEKTHSESLPPHYWAAFMLSGDWR